jgi:hypothetical protein
MTRIVTTAYRYKRPPRGKRKTALDVLAVVRASEPTADADRKPAIVTARRPGRRYADVPDLTLQELQRRGEAADAPWRELGPPGDRQGGLVQQRIDGLQRPGGPRDPRAVVHGPRPSQAASVVAPMLGNSPPITREDAYSRPVALDVAAIVSDMTRVRGKWAVTSPAMWSGWFERDSEGLRTDGGQRVAHFDPFQRSLPPGIGNVEGMHHTARWIHQRNRMIH